MGELGKFERKLPEDRRKTLIDATLACLARDGTAGLSIRKISKEAGISIGLINHHYAGKDELVGAAYEAFSLGHLDATRARIAQAGGNSRAKLNAYVRGLLSAPMLEQGTLRVWVVFWSIIENSAPMMDVHDRTYAEYRSLLGELLADAGESISAPAVNTHLAAIGLTAMLDGLWLEWCINPTTFSPDDAIGLCENWIDALFAGLMPRLLVNNDLN
ncbi:MAG: transcriptional regulator [Rhizobium sp.]|nr:transcriptional regulator [Rhizobium sp.]